VLLQDQVPGFPGDLAVKIIEEELGKPIEELFDTFDRKYIAAASLGQVHLATMGGKKLAIKVQRQGLKKLFDMDLKNIKLLAIILDKFDPKSDGAQRDWASIYDESAKLLYREIDYELEALNSIRFKENFANVPWVKVPDVSNQAAMESMTCQISAFAPRYCAFSRVVLFIACCLLFSGGFFVINNNAAFRKSILFPCCGALL
jgi:predicted unusual protein kinase regulating ubiquinone biosynthesis (AarF/ABC1/UbiB family)